MVDSWRFDYLRILNSYFTRVAYGIPLEVGSREEVRHRQIPQQVFLISILMLRWNRWLTQMMWSVCTQNNFSCENQSLTWRWGCSEGMGMVRILKMVLFGGFGGVLGGWFNTLVILFMFRDVGLTLSVILFSLQSVTSLCSCPTFPEWASQSFIRRSWTIGNEMFIWTTALTRQWGTIWTWSVLSLLTSKIRRTWILIQIVAGKVFVMIHFVSHTNIVSIAWVPRITAMPMPVLVFTMVLTGCNTWFCLHCNIFKIRGGISTRHGIWGTFW